MRAQTEEFTIVDLGEFERFEFVSDQKAINGVRPDGSRTFLLTAFDEDALHKAATEFLLEFLESLAHDPDDGPPVVLIPAATMIYDKMKARADQIRTKYERRDQIRADQIRTMYERADQISTEYERAESRAADERAKAAYDESADKPTWKALFSDTTFLVGIVLLGVLLAVILFLALR